MAGKGSPPGVRQGGRQKGTPNKVTADARETFRLVFEKLAPEAEGWIRAAAKKSPAKGAELLMRLAEHFVPKIARNEITGPDGEGGIQVILAPFGPAKLAPVDASDPDPARSPPTWPVADRDQPPDASNTSDVNVGENRRAVHASHKPSAIPGMGLIPDERGAGAPCALPRIDSPGLAPELRRALRERNGLIDTEAPRIKLGQ